MKNFFTTIKRTSSSHRIQIGGGLVLDPLGLGGRRAIYGCSSSAAWRLPLGYLCFAEDARDLIWAWW